MNVYQTRQEHDFYKFLAKVVAELPPCSQKEEIIALVDGYFLTSRARVRQKDVSNEIKETLIVEGLKKGETNDINSC